MWMSRLFWNSSLDIRTFLAKALLVHGNKFNYSNVSHEHIKGNIPVIRITCITCNTSNTCLYNWMPIIHDHINGKHACPRCKRSNVNVYQLNCVYLQ